MSPRIQFGKLERCALLICSFVIGAFFVLLFLPDMQQITKRNRPPEHERIRQIVLAVGEYHEKHGHFPHDERGADHALYQLHPFISVSAFQPVDHHGTRPHWDHDQQKLCGAHILYFNQPIPKPPATQLILLARPKANSKGTTAAFGDGRVSHVSFAVPPDGRVLGSFQTVDNLFVVGERLFEELTVTHVVSGRGWTTTHGTNGALATASVDNRSLVYNFQDGHLKTCTISAPHGTVTESFTTDQFGRLTGVTRVPDDWRKILGVDKPSENALVVKPTLPDKHLFAAASPRLAAAYLFGQHRTDLESRCCGRSK